MSEFTSTGVVTKTLDEWYNDVVSFKQAVWGNDFVTDPTTKQGADVLQLAELLYNAEMNNVSAFAQLNLNTATGICLDYIGFVRGISRNGGYPQEITVEITSAATGYTLGTDIAFRTTTGNLYYAPAPVAITSLTQKVVLEYSSDGDPDINIGDPLTTVQPFTNVVSAVVAQEGMTAGTPSIIAGADTETDASYRKRIQDADIGFIGTLELMRAEMAKISGMSKLKILYNDEAVTDANNIPAYNTEFLVVPQSGADDTTFNAAVANKILEIKVPGAPLYGNTTVTIPDYYGESKNIRFTRPSQVTCQFTATITASSGIIDTSRLDTEKQAIVDYIQSVDVGAPVEWSRVLGMIAGDTGFVIVNWGLRKGTTGPWVQTNISCGVREYLWATLSDIIIEVQ